MLIIIEGNIGAGKSTLAKELTATLGARAFYEPVESNPYLIDFYQDPGRWALEMQYWLMARRYEMHEEAIQHINRTGQAVVMDRSIYGDSVFAKKNWQDGHIDDRGYRAYLQHRKLYIDRLLTPQMTLFLNATPEICHHRIHHLRKRDCEAGVPIEYLRGLDKCYGELLMELEDRGSQIYRLPWNEFLATEEVLKTIEADARFSVFWRGYAKHGARAPIGEPRILAGLC